MPFEADNQKVRQFFESLLAQHGDSKRALAYGSQRSQEGRFHALVQIGNLNSATVLDVGCGFADLYDYILARFPVRHYTGCEISPKIAEVANRRHPGLDVRVCDILTWETEERFDYVLGTGFNCVLTGNNEAMIYAMVRRMYALCRRGVSVGMVSDYQHAKHESTYYASPEALFSFCMNLCGRVALRHDYLPHDFTLYLYK